MDVQIWSAVAVILVSYLAGTLYQTHHWDQRIGDLRSDMNRRFDDFREWLRAGRP